MSLTSSTSSPIPDPIPAPSWIDSSSSSSPSHYSSSFSTSSSSSLPSRPIWEDPDPDSLKELSQRLDLVPAREDQESIARWKQDFKKFFSKNP